MPLPAPEPMTTARLLLRGVQIDDLPALMAVSGDPEVTRFLPYETWTSEADGLAWYGRVQALLAGGGAQQYVITLRTADGPTGAPTDALTGGPAIGTALLFRHDAGSRRIELGYALSRAHWRQGLAREAATALLSYAFERLDVHRVEAEVDPNNQGSNALLRALGFTREGFLRDRWTTKGRTYDTHLYSLLSTDTRPA